MGKTTTAAARAAMAAAHLGGKVLVLTVDPAKRLANALGLEQFGNAETRVPDEPFTAAGVEPRGELWAAMLDTKQSWDDLVRRHAPDAATRDAILANPLYQNITGRFVQSHDYIAMERLYEIHASGPYDLIVVDTPPTRNAIDFLEAPERMADFFSQPPAALADRAVRVAAVQRGVQALLQGGRPHPRLAVPRGHRRVLHPLPDHVRRLRRAGRGGHPHPAGQAHHVRGGLHAGGGAGCTRPSSSSRRSTSASSTSAPSCSTRCCPPTSVDRRHRRGPRPGTDADALAEQVGPDAVAAAEPDPAMVARVLREVGESFLNYQVVAKREAEQRAELARSPDVVATVPYFDTDIYDLAGLLRLGEQIWR